MSKDIDNEVIDNRTIKLGDRLNENLSKADKFDLVTAYFSLFGFDKLSKNLTKKNLKTRFLYGTPISSQDITIGDKTKISFKINDKDISLEQVKEGNGLLSQRKIAIDCINWVKSKNVEVKAIDKENFLHGKVYLTTKNSSSDAIVGSSNLTLRGLGKSKNPNIEVNVDIKDDNTKNKLNKWFEEIWQIDDAVEAKDDFIAELKRWHQTYSPESIYFKSLYEIFKEDLDAKEETDDSIVQGNLQNSCVYKKLFDFQRDGVDSVLARLKNYNGCILSDSVGLGKTFSALAVIKAYELRGKNVLVIVPKKLYNNWQVFQGSSGSSQNILQEDKLSFTLILHTDLTRTEGLTGNVNLAELDYSSFDLIVIDESHNFRNKTVQKKLDDGSIKLGRYDRLMEEAIKKGGNSKVLLLSATPVNTSLIDLLNQIHLITAQKDDYYRDTLNIEDITNVIKNADKKFHEWSNPNNKNKSKEALLDSFSNEFKVLMSKLIIARSRQQIKKFYGDYINKNGDFPIRKIPISLYKSLDTNDIIKYEDLCNDIDNLNFSTYNPSKYLKGGNKDTKNYEAPLVEMLKSNLYKRLESSCYSLKLTIERTIKRIDYQLVNIEKYINNKNYDDISNIIDEDYDTEDEDIFTINKKYSLENINIDDYKKNLNMDKNSLIKIVNKLENIITNNSKRDNKLKTLVKIIENKLNEENKKLLIFTTFTDTAKHLYDNICRQLNNKKMNIALITGEINNSNVGLKDYSKILNYFSPIGRNITNIEREKEIDILIATDCISEGQNLPDCDSVVNYDIHWNPVNLIQRFGRIDRLGSKNKHIQMINFWPTSNLEEYLNLEKRVKNRMALAVTATGDEDQLNYDEKSQTNNSNYNEFRTELNRRIYNKEDINDLEETDESLKASDLTLDSFYLQLLNYITENKANLERIPYGSYSISNKYNKDISVNEGVIFLFKQIKYQSEQSISSLNRFFMVYAGKDKIEYGYSNANKILRLYNELASGKTKANNKLEDKFIKYIEDNDTAKYDELLQNAVENIYHIYEEKLEDSLLNGNIIPKKENRPIDNNLELVTWFIIED